MAYKNIYGFLRAGVAVPSLKVGNPIFNGKEIQRIAAMASSKHKVKVLVFPELSISGYTCGDLFHQRVLLKSCEDALETLLQGTKTLDMLIAVGMPIKADNQLFNCGVLFHRGEILGVVPKTFVPNYNEYYEKRWFASSKDRISEWIDLCGQRVAFGENLLFQDTTSELCIAAEICEDLWTPIPPSSRHAMYGANLILNPSASNEIVGKHEYRQALVKQQSARCIASYLYVSAGQSESTTDVVFSGHGMIAENGRILEETRFAEEATFIFYDIDIEKLMNDRRKNNSFMGKFTEGVSYEKISFTFTDIEIGDIKREIDPAPFVPASKEKRTEKCKEIFTIQSIGLAERLLKTGIDTVVVGISGGLDSTLALLVCVEAFDRLKISRKNIIGITMPGFGTTGRTYNNALLLMKELGITVKEIAIEDACIQHFNDIGHDMSVKDVTYENVQARERTQILMDIANKESGLVVGTGDLSELALGWCTYNGDHMSMYGVNVSIPKTLVRYLVQWYADTAGDTLMAKILNDISNTPVSPELLPPDKEGKIEQKTEEIIGSYDLHDFFLFNMLRHGFSPSKIFLLATIAFRGKWREEEILHWLKIFYKRFFTQQFKRSCLPDGPKVGSICLSPRGDWRMPSDASYEIWLNELENMIIR
ncbi:NAD(+) synthase [Clostridium formicaceticum]|uniref:Glutamine-dependent NAD(+) synthetase n=1 Tax=Clostridium formicaceticum TaxID=1497 RepID=A0AAC9RMQ1_9CLOT|nr:NAD(+) synthase [Clostridium formicaceticum]AOY74530.1 NAD(+) synthase [Clostridium formicaceticum]ARE88886.1 Glutamine-dependent NAD(+) synthetase [Clostridium formicaceticum]